MDAETARFLRRLAAQTKDRYPDVIRYYNAGASEGAAGLIRVRRPHWPDGMAQEVPGVDGGPAGGVVTVRFNRASRQLPWVGTRERSGGGGAGPAAPVFWGAWPQSEGSPLCNRSAPSSLPAPKWAYAESIGIGTLYTMPRYFYGDELHPGAPLGLASLLSHEGVVMGPPGRAAVLGSLYNEDASSLVGYLLTEVDFIEGIAGQWLITLGIPIGTLATNNRQRVNGFLFYDAVAGNYTVATVNGLAVCHSGNTGLFPGLIGITGWEQGYEGVPEWGHVGAAGDFALQGAWAEFDAFSDSREDSSIHLYRRKAEGGDVFFEHVERVSIAEQLPDMDFVFGCGEWDPFGDSEALRSENTRWPFLPNNKEWLVWAAGQVGAGSLPSDTQAKLLAVKAATGAVRTVHDYHGPIIARVSRDGLQSDIIEELTYKSEPHVENWEPTGPPYFWVDNGGPNGWPAGTMLTYDQVVSLCLGGTIPEADWRYGSPGGLGINLKVYTSWDGLEPVSAPSPPRLECAGAAVPRGIVDPATGHSWFVVREGAWQTEEAAGDDDTDGPGEGYAYAGYDDVILGGGEGRLFKFTKQINGRYVWRDSPDQMRLLHFGADGLLGSFDLTRQVSRVGEDGKTRHNYLTPDVFEYSAQGDYIWVLAADWWELEAPDLAEQRLTLILVNKISHLEVARLDLRPSSASLWDVAKGRPTLYTGSDLLGPYAQVGLHWSDSGGGGYFRLDEIRYNTGSGELVKSVRLSPDLGLGEDGEPDDYRERVNLAYGAGQQLWLDGLRLRRVTES